MNETQAHVSKQWDYIGKKHIDPHDSVPILVVLLLLIYLPFIAYGISLVVRLFPLLHIPPQ